jgi:hypothetical protein
MSHQIAVPTVDLALGAAARTATDKPPSLPVIEPPSCDDLPATEREVVSDAIVANRAWCPLENECAHSLLQCHWRPR